MMHATGSIARAFFPFFSMVYLCDVGFPYIGELSAYLGRCFRSVFKFSAGANSLPKLVNQTKKEATDKRLLLTVHQDSSNNSGAFIANSRVAGQGTTRNLFL